MLVQNTAKTEFIIWSFLTYSHLQIYKMTRFQLCIIEKKALEMEKFIFLSTKKFLYKIPFLNEYCIKKLTNEIYSLIILFWFVCEYYKYLLRMQSKILLEYAVKLITMCMSFRNNLINAYNKFRHFDVNIYHKYADTVHF